MPCVLVFCVIWFFSSAPLGFPSPTPRFQGLGCLGFRRRVGVSRLAGLCCFAPPSLPPSCLCPAAQVRFLRRFGRDLRLQGFQVVWGSEVARSFRIRHPRSAGSFVCARLRVFGFWQALGSEVARQCSSFPRSSPFPWCVPFV